ncbi:MAG TPA: nucleoside recognition domain-containing protein [Chitinophagales bacterium]|nr:nucleoside recognition domain-containing protein [Chitinophagales bacterium]HMX59102.1 nucleoside recognition domain-containing protein [Chitinophagales bacterium]HMZ33293.1 nucleoside recognition domain-containing protein [Chitinophagales bacterium]HNA38284.1 nucleoside recognition domain-containing protein [Chitinophagales bacterium]HNF17733.1 nucleoside recognition domain-containing protein [Chitinophagales bacterium]
MILNYIWILFFVLSFIIILVKMLIFGDMTVMPASINAITDSSKTAFEISLGLTGVMCFWLGIMKVGENGGAINIFSKLISPFFSRLFPEIPKDHPAMGSILMNYSANMLGLDNAATPLGLKAMKKLQEINPNKEQASNSMIMFLTLNTAGFTIIPVSIIAFRATAGAANPTDIFLPLLIATYGGMIAGLILCTFIQKIKWDFVLTAWVLGIVGFIAGLTYLFSTMPKEQMEIVSNVLGGLIILTVIITFIAFAFFKKVNVYEAFIDGAKEGFDITIKIIPYLVAMLVGIGIFRACGGMEIITHGIAYCFNSLGFDTQFVDALPVAIMKPFSGSGARGLMVDLIKPVTEGGLGADSFAGRLAGIFNGSHDTTFYVLAVYFGAVAIKKTRYVVATSLFAELVSIILSIVVCYVFFG